MTQINHYLTKSAEQYGDCDDHFMVGLNVISGEIAINEILTSPHNGAKWRIDSLARFQAAGEHDPSYFIVAMERVEGTDRLKPGDHLFSQ